MRSRVLARVTIVGLAGVLAVGGCGGDDDDTAEQTDDADKTEESTTTTTTAPESTTTTFAPDTQAAIDVYNRMWEVEFEALALKPPNPQYPGLSNVLTGVALQSILDVIIAVAQHGQYVIDGRMETHPVPEVETSDLVVITDCTVEHGSNLNIQTDAVEASGPYEPAPRRIEITKQEGTWRVSKIETFEEETCTPE